MVGGHGIVQQMKVEGVTSDHMRLQTAIHWNFFLVHDPAVGP